MAFSYVRGRIEELCQRLYGQQNLKYLLVVLLQKKVCWSLPRKMSANAHTKTSPRMSMAALLILAKKTTQKTRNNSNVLWYEWINSGKSIQWDFTQQYKEMNNWNIQHNESQTSYAEWKKPEGGKKRVHTKWFQLYKVLENRKQSIMTKCKSVVAWKQGMGHGRAGRRNQKWTRWNFRDDGYVHYLDCCGGFMGVYLVKHFKCVVYCM